MKSTSGSVVAAYKKDMVILAMTKAYDVIWSGKQPLLPERDTQVDNRWAKMPVPDEEREAPKESRKYHRSEKWLKSRELRRKVATDLLTPSANAEGGSQFNVKVLGSDTNSESTQSEVQHEEPCDD